MAPLFNGVFYCVRRAKFHATAVDKAFSFRQSEFKEQQQSINTRV
jgi:hypothetical protein